MSIRSRSGKPVRRPSLGGNRKIDFGRSSPAPLKEIVPKVDQAHDRERLDNWENDGGASASVIQERNGGTDHMPISTLPK